MDKVKIIVVGCGSIGMRHLKNLLLRRDVELAAMDPRPGAKDDVNSLDNSILFFTEDSQAVKWRPELAVIATPNHLHKFCCLWAFENGMDVLCEKPLADTVESGQAIVSRAKQAGKVVAVGFTERYREAVKYIIEECRSGSLGTLIGGRAMVGTYNTLLCAKDPEHRQNTFGSILVDYVHELDILGEIFGDLKRLECYANCLGRKELQADPSLASILIEYQNAAVAQVHLDYVQHPQRRTLEIYGDKKTFCYDFGQDRLEIFDCEKDGVVTRFFNNVRNEQFVREHDDILNAVRTGVAPAVTGREGLRSLIVAEAAINRLNQK
jgi:predicted dehydrogenase